jgi:hypothetical protein
VPCLPATTIDTFFACTLLVILVVSAMAVMPKVMYPFMDGLAHKNDSERLQQLAQYILLSTGTPSDWGNSRSVVPSSFGLALNNTMPYFLDADKVTRLNSRNRYAITYAQLLDALKVSNIALKISIQPIFNTSIALLSSVNNGNQTSYNFEVTTENSGLAVASDLSSYFVIRDYVDNTVISTDSSGIGVASFTVPNSVNGSALLIVFARAETDPSVVSYGVYSFGHNASVPEPNETFTRPSPLNHVLNASLNYPDERISSAYAFSYDYWTNLTQLSNATQTIEYAFPRFLDKSATILVLTGFNGTKSFAEWTAYPQVPLGMGINFDSSTSKGDVASFTYIVTINSALYALQIKCREVG